MIVGDHKGALADYGAAIKITPRNLSAYYNRALAQLDSDDKDGATADLRLALKFDPRMKDAREMLHEIEPKKKRRRHRPRRYSASHAKSSRASAPGTGPAAMPSNTSSCSMSDSLFLPKIVLSKVGPMAPTAACDRAMTKG